MLSRKYKPFPERERFHMGYWIRSATIWRALRGNPAYDEFFKTTTDWRGPQFAYDYYSNTVSIAIGALAEPLYYKRATAAITFGGLGSAFAECIVKSLDADGIKIDAGRRLLPWWLDSANVSYKEKSSCGAPRGGSVFPEVPALEVSYHAFQESVKNDLNSAEDHRLAGSESYSGDQIFFLTYCYYFCGPSAERCNKAVKNFSPFAMAFGCAPGTPMNPRKKCTFFYP